MLKADGEIEGLRTTNVYLSAVIAGLREGLRQAHRGIAKLKEQRRQKPAHDPKAIELLKRWRARGFPMGGTDLWDDTIAFLDNEQRCAEPPLVVDGECQQDCDALGIACPKRGVDASGEGKP